MSHLSNFLDPRRDHYYDGFLFWSGTYGPLVFNLLHRALHCWPTRLNPIEDLSKDPFTSELARDYAPLIVNLYVASHSPVTDSDHE
jgi:hypothetical protein